MHQPCGHGCGPRPLQGRCAGGHEVHAQHAGTSYGPPKSSVISLLEPESWSTTKRQQAAIASMPTGVRFIIFICSLQVPTLSSHAPLLTLHLSSWTPTGQAVGCGRPHQWLHAASRRSHLQGAHAVHKTLCLPIRHMSLHKHVCSAVLTVTPAAAVRSEPGVRLALSGDWALWPCS